jgi:hypothetical protein
MQLGGYLALASNVRTTALGLVTLLWCGCDDGQSVEATIDAKPGIQQGSADGPLLDEGEACEALYEALIDAKSSCGDVTVAECPELIRPGGSLACVRYSEESVRECVAAIEEYSSCKDFVRDACVVVAVVDESTDGCVPPGPDEDAGPDDTTDDDAADDDAADDDAADDDAADDAGGDDDVGGPSDAGDTSDDASTGELLDSGLVEASEAGSGSSDAGTPLVVDSGSGSGNSDASP